MPRRRTMLIDSRLLGTWKSDRRRTLRDLALRGESFSEPREELRSLFGKLVVEFGDREILAEHEGRRFTAAYRVLASDAESVAISFFDAALEQQRICHIHFEGSHLWISLGAMREFFRRVEQ